MYFSKMVMLFKSRSFKLTRRASRPPGLENQVSRQAVTMDLGMAKIFHSMLWTRLHGTMANDGSNFCSQTLALGPLARSTLY